MLLFWSLAVLNDVCLIHLLSMFQIGSVSIFTKMFSIQSISSSPGAEPMPLNEFCECTVMLLRKLMCLLKIPLALEAFL